MESNNELVKVEKSTHYTRYLLIIGILVLAFSLSFMLRVTPADQGFELNEFDPFFNYRATEFMVENGFPAYFEWHDDLSWHPYGRDVSATSQVMLHTTGAILYQAFGMGSSLYDFTIFFPVVVSSLTTIIIFALVRTVGGTTAGLFASLFFAVSPMIMLRGMIGWYKSEPLGLFYGLLAVYLLISGIKSDKGKVSIAKIAGAGVILAFGLASWGGVQFFILPIGLFFVALPFMRKDNKFIIWASVLFVSVFFLVTGLFEKTGISFTSSLNGLFLVGCTGFLIACSIIKKISKNQLRNCFIFLGCTIVAGIAILSSGLLWNHLPSFRYLNAANPFLIATDMLTDSVSEHATPTIDLTFFFFSVLMIFAGIGAWLLFQKKVTRSLKIKDEMAAFVLILGFLGIYFSSSFVRLEIYGAISILVLASVSLSILISRILKTEHGHKRVVTQISFLSIIAVLLIVPMTYPTGLNWSNNLTNYPVTILNSGTSFDIVTNDWPDAMQWLKANTSEDAVIAAWWDYGYWISTLGERKTLADNSTVLDWQIRKIASTFMSTPDDAWQILTTDTKTDVRTHYVSLPSDISYRITQTGPVVLSVEEHKFDVFKRWKDCVVDNTDCSTWTNPPGTRTGTYDASIAAKYPTLFAYWESEMYYLPLVLTGLDADYLLINLAVDKLSEENMIDVYTMRQKGGDETKAFWFAKISDLKLFNYYHSDAQSYTDKFWNETLLGKLIPFTVIAYVDPNNTQLQSTTYKPNYVAIYVKNIKFPADGDGPFQLVYVPPSFERDEPGPMTGPLIYKINKEYKPNQ